jgi:hypothetical protein
MLREPCPHLVVDKFGHCENCLDFKDGLHELRRPAAAPAQAEKSLHYRAAYSDSDSHGVRVCEHQHRTICSATACISAAQGYVVGFENGKVRALTDSEEAQFRTAMSGLSGSKRRNAFDPHLFIIMLVKLGLQRF